MELVGEVVTLRPLGWEHVDALVEAAGHDRSTYGLTWVPADRADAERYVGKALADADRGVSMPFVQCLTAGGEVVGSTRYLNIERWGPPFADPSVVEIGSTWLSAGVQRTAVNTEAKLLLLTQAFEGFGVERVWIKTDALNERSRAAIERLGAHFEGVLRRQAPAYGRPGPRDTASYSIVPEEWPAVKARLLDRLGRGTRSAD